MDVLGRDWDGAYMYALKSTTASCNLLCRHFRGESQIDVVEKTGGYIGARHSYYFNAFNDRIPARVWSCHRDLRHTTLIIWSGSNLSDFSSSSSQDMFASRRYQFPQSAKVDIDWRSWTWTLEAKEGNWIRVFYFKFQSSIHLKAPV